MRIPLGYNATQLKYDPNNPDKALIYWDTEKLINGHLILAGKSGSGKTFTLRKLLLNILKQVEFIEADRKNNPDKYKNKKVPTKFRVHVIDVHGDIDLGTIKDKNGNEIELASTVKFSEATNYGFNPLLINKDKHFGGVRKRIQSFLSSLNRTGFKLGGNQEATLRNLLVDLYAANGVFEDRPESWDIPRNVKFPRNPTIDDLARFTESKMKSMFLGIVGKTNCTSSLEKVNKVQNKLFKRMKTLGKATNEEVDKIQSEIDKLKAEAIEYYSEYVTNINSGMELSELLKYDSLDVMKSLSNKINNLNSIGIFKNEPPPFDLDKNIWRYDIKSLDIDEKALFVSFLCESLFYRAVQRGEESEVVEIIVLDEAHLFVNDDPRNPINTIAKEARKFGLALFAASQSLTHFSDDFLSNVSTKIILGIDQIYWSNSINKLKITEEALKWIIFHKRILIQVNNKGDTKNEFYWVYNNKDDFYNLNRNK